MIPAVVQGKGRQECIKYYCGAYDPEDFALRMVEYPYEPEGEGDFYSVFDWALEKKYIDQTDYDAVKKGLDDVHLE